MDKKRCFNCNKKIKLIGYDCKCLNHFCSKCRLPEIHNCTYNFRLKGKEILQNNLIKVTASKINKI
jgi:predicted nucleic acid binding AN1-type Zn finger protein